MCLSEFIKFSLGPSHTVCQHLISFWRGCAQQVWASAPVQLGRYQAVIIYTLTFVIILAQIRH